MGAEKSYISRRSPLSTSLTHASMADAVWRPGNRVQALARDLALVLGFSLLAVLSARLSFELPSAVGSAYGSLLGRLGIQLPNTPVPVSGQTFAVLLAGLVLGSRRGGAAMLLYLGYGLLGLGVFALGNSAWSPSRVPGVPVILGPTAGYLLSYPVAAFVVGLLAERGWDRRFLTTALAMLIGSAVIYAVALPWLAIYVPARAVLAAGMYPFLPGDIVKLLLAAGLLPSAWLTLSSLGLLQQRENR